jgi:hypothetical protein
VDRRSSRLSFVRAVPAALLLALVVPGVAQADATISVTGTAPHQTLTYTVDDALDHTTMPLIMSGDLRIDDNVGIASGCAPVGGMFDCGPAADFERIVFAFGDGDDHLDLLQWDMSIAVLANGGGGDDVLEGGVVGDELTGGPGDDELYGADGDDVLTGGEGNDYLSGGPGVDHFDGGEGDDHLSTVDTPAAADLSISCGAGDDVVLDYDDADGIDADCETTDPPLFDGALGITGTAWAGQLLGLSLPTNLGGDGEAGFQWERCDATGSACHDIDGAGDATYTLTAADLGSRVRARYWIVNALGYDSIESGATGTVRAGPMPPTHHPAPTHQSLAPPRPPAAPAQRLVLGPFRAGRKPSLIMRKGRPVIDTGRSIRCPRAFGLYPCQLSATARPSGRSGLVRGRPAIAGAIQAQIASGTWSKVMVPLNRRAYRLLRAHRRLTLSVTTRLTRSLGYTPARATFAITVKAPARRKG